MTLDDLAQSLNALERSDISAFQRRARVLQSIWREERGYPCGEHGSGANARLLGSRLVMPWAKETLSNFLTDPIRRVVTEEVLNRPKGDSRLFGQPRIFNDLLSSQPLCFNLFAELRSDLDLASGLVDSMTGGRFSKVLGIEFEFSPGRGDERFTGDRSAFDFFLNCGKGFVGIEVKYHENLKGEPGRHRGRYDEVASDMGCFGDTERLKAAPLQQIWRDHLLAGALRLADESKDGVFVLLHPEANGHVAKAVEDYRACLKDASSFDSWTLEAVLGQLAARSSAAWISAFRDRYLAFEKVDARLRE